MALLYDRLVPILQVADLQAERDFYVALGFTVNYEGPELPTFVALAHGPIEFGIQQDEDVTPEMADRVLRWQFGVPDIAAATARLTEAGVAFREEWVTPRGLEISCTARPHAEWLPPDAGGERTAVARAACAQSTREDTRCLRHSGARWTRCICTPFYE